MIPSPDFPAEPDRYVLYFNYGCPWAHRTTIVRTLKGLDDLIELVEVDDMDPGPDKGWFFSGRFGPARDPITGAKYLRELYLKTDPAFTGRVTVPVLWDKKTGTLLYAYFTWITCSRKYRHRDVVLPRPWAEELWVKS